MEKARIMLVEDSEPDIDLIKYSIKKNRIEADLIIKRDGAEALSYMEECTSGVSLLPDLIIMDINLPKINGLEVLRSIKDNVQTRVIPVVILTTSNTDEDVKKAYEAHVNAYLVKPVEAEAFIQIILQLEQFMLRIVRRTNS